MKPKERRDWLVTIIGAVTALISAIAALIVAIKS